MTALIILIPPWSFKKSVNSLIVIEYIWIKISTWIILHKKLDSEALQTEYGIYINMKLDIYGISVRKKASNSCQMKSWWKMNDREKNTYTQNAAPDE